MAARPPSSSTDPIEHEQAVAHGEGDAIVTTTSRWAEEADVALELLAAGKTRAASPKVRTDKPVEGSGKVMHHKKSE
jgi:hypothetical protein